MKQSQITLIVIGFILLALMATNPSIEDHRQAVVEKVKENIAKSSNSDSKNQWQKAGEVIGMAIGQGILEKAVSRENYLLFSLTKVSFGDKSNNIGVGILGKVSVKDYDDIKESLSANDIDNNERDMNNISQNEWLGNYNNYYPSIPDNYDPNIPFDAEGFGHCNPGKIDLEIKFNGNNLSVIIQYHGFNARGAYQRTETEWNVIDFNNDYLICETEAYYSSSTLFKQKIYKKNSKIYVKNLSQHDCEDFEIKRD